MVFIQGQLNPSGLWTLTIMDLRNNAPLTLPLPLPWLTQSRNVWLSWLGAALTDSPLGLAAYIIEKFYTWTDSDTVNMPLAEATKSLPFSIDKALNNVMVYWHSNSITSSVRLYKEAISEAANPPLWVKLLTVTRFICGYYAENGTVWWRLHINITIVACGMHVTKRFWQNFKSSPVFLPGSGKMIYETFYCICVLCKEKYASV